MEKELIKYIDKKCTTHLIDDCKVYKKEDIEEAIKEFFIMKGF